MPEGQHDFSTWRNVIESGGLAGQPINFQTSQVTNSSMMHGLLQQVLTDSLGTEPVSGSRTDGLGQWQVIYLYYIVSIHCVAIIHSKISMPLHFYFSS